MDQNWARHILSLLIVIRQDLGGIGDMMASEFLSLEFRLGSHDADRAIAFLLITEDVWLCLFGNSCA